MSSPGEGRTSYNFLNSHPVRPAIRSVWAAVHRRNPGNAFRAGHPGLRVLPEEPPAAAGQFIPSTQRALPMGKNRNPLPGIRGLSAGLFGIRLFERPAERRSSLRNRSAERSLCRSFCQNPIPFLSDSAGFFRIIPNHRHPAYRSGRLSSGISHHRAAAAAADSHRTDAFFFGRI